MSALSHPVRMLLTVVLFAVATAAPAQSPAPFATPDLSTLTFSDSVGPVAASQVGMIGADSAGGTYLGGPFTQVNGLSTVGAARLNADGTLDTTWTSGLSSGIAEIAHVDGGGGVNLVSRDTNATTWQLTRRTISTVTPLYTATSGYALSAVTSDPAGNLYVAESAQSIVLLTAGATTATIYRISPSGSGRMPNFAIMLNGQNPCETVGMRFGIVPRALSMVHDGVDKLYVVGDFTSASASFGGALQSAAFGGAVRVSLSQNMLDASWGPMNRAIPPASSPVSAGLEKLTCVPLQGLIVHSVVVPGDGFVYLGGSFAAQGAAALARFSEADGAIDPGWLPAHAAATGTSIPVVYTLALDRERHRIYAGALDGSIGAMSRSLAAFWLFPGAATDTAWDPNPNGSVGASSINGARLTVGGSFSSFGTAARTKVAALPLSGTSIINNYYQSILGRAPDANGVSFWGNTAVSLAARGVSPNEAYIAMAMFFFSSPEFTSVPLTDAQFVDKLYLTFFNRTADTAGERFWVNEIQQSGLTRDMVMFAFMFSSEFDSYMAANLNGPYTMRPEVGVVMDFYRGALARLPDAAGLRAWVNTFRNAQCSGDPVGGAYQAATAISDAFFNSAEYAQRARTDPQYVSDLYNAFMRRSADGNGFFFWTTQVASRGRPAVRSSFIGTPEFGARVQAIANAGCVAPMP